MYTENRDSRVGFRGKINNQRDIKMSSPEGKKENQGGQRHKSHERAGCWGKNTDVPRKTGMSEDRKEDWKFVQNIPITVDLSKIPLKRGNCWEDLFEIQ